MLVIGTVQPLNTVQEMEIIMKQYLLKVYTRQPTAMEEHILL